jgi:aminoglycoside phosphotransferase (APT) family kinase protein
MQTEQTRREPLGIDEGALVGWFAEHVPDAKPPLRYERITGGHSCLTYLVTDAHDARCVLRRPPVGELLATAHDVAREHDIMTALEGSAVPVPRMLGACRDAEVTGAPFFVMAYVDGVVLNNSADADRLLPSRAARQHAAESLVDALAALHAVDVDAVGLGDLSRRTGYLDRQLKRWSAQWETYGLDDLLGMVRLHDWLVDHRPGESVAGIVHGDFRLGNALLAPDGEVLAVLDWELCTLGEPLADVAYLLRTWSTADAKLGPDQLPSALPGFPFGEELTSRYAERSGRSLERLGYWMAFTAWRAAAILGGVYRRYLDGKMGTPPDDLASYRVEVERRIRQGLQFAGLV